MYNLLALLLNPLPQQPAEQYEQNKKVSVDEVCQLLLMTLVSETYVTEADVWFFVARTLLDVFHAYLFPSPVRQKKKVKSPNGAAFSELECSLLGSSTRYFLLYYMPIFVFCNK